MNQSNLYYFNAYNSCKMKPACLPTCLTILDNFSKTCNGLNPRFMHSFIPHSINFMVFSIKMPKPDFWSSLPFLNQVEERIFSKFQLNQSIQTKMCLPACCLPEFATNLKYCNKILLFFIKKILQ